MKNLPVWVIVFFTIAPLSSWPLGTGDGWDPGDDRYENATPLSIPTLDRASHGPHTLSPNDPYDWFRVLMEPDVTYEFFATGDSDTAAELFASDGRTILASDDDSGAQINFRLRYQSAQAGIYYLRVRLYSLEQSGSYTLHYLIRKGVSVPPDSWDPMDDSPSGATLLDTPPRGGLEHGPHSLSGSDGEDWFIFALVQGETYAFQSIGDSDVVAELYREEGFVRVAMGDDSENGENFRIVYTAPQSGSFLLRVRMFEEGIIGSYTLQVQSGVPPLPAGDAWDPADDISDGGTDLGSPTLREQMHGPHTLSPSDRFDWFLFTLSAGAQYRFYSTGGSDTLADLFAADGQTFLGGDDNSGGENNFSLTFSPQSSGKYFLRVRSFQDRDAAYQLAYVLLENSTPIQRDTWDPADDDFQKASFLNEPSTTVQTHGPHSLSTSDRYDWFAFSLLAGKSYEFWTSGPSDTVGELYRDDGTTPVTQEDEGGTDYNFRLYFTPLTNGTYYLLVRMFDRGSQGSYTLHYAASTSTPSGMDEWDPADDSVQGASLLGTIQSIDIQHGPHTLSATDSSDWYALNLAVGADYQMYTTGGSDTAARLFNSDGLTLAAEQDNGGAQNNFKMYFSPAIAGTYYLQVYELRGENAAYTLHIAGSPHALISIKPDPVFTIQSPEEFITIPGGFENRPSGTAATGSIPGNIYEITDGKGVTLTAAPGETILIQFPRIETGGETILLRAQVGSSGAGASVALAALDGGLDGSIATNIPADSGEFRNRYRWMNLIYNPPCGSFYPLFQVSNSSESQTVSVYLDTVEIYELPPEGNLDSTLFLPIAPQTATYSFPPLPYKVYPLADREEFIEQPGGYLNAPPGQVALEKISTRPGDFSDGRGAILTAGAGEVEMLLFPEIPVGDGIVLIRARIQKSGGAVALGAVDASLDGSIATNIAMSAADDSSAPGVYRWVSLFYDPPGSQVIPLIQLAGVATVQQNSLILDTLEIYRFEKGSRIPSRLFLEE